MAAAGEDAPNTGRPEDAAPEGPEDAAPEAVEDAAPVAAPEVPEVVEDVAPVAAPEVPEVVEDPAPKGPEDAQQAAAGDAAPAPADAATVAVKVGSAADPSPSALTGSPATRASETVPPEVLLAEARNHMRRTACSAWSEEKQRYEFLSVWSTTHEELSVLGVGVRLYFDFIRQMGAVFLVLSILAAPSIYFNVMGTMVDDSAGFNSLISKVSVANLGNCPATGCRSLKETRARCALDVTAGPCELPLEDVTEWLGLLDGLGVLVFILFGVWFSHRWIPRIVRATDHATVTPADYTVWVTNLQSRLKGEDHTRYKELVAEHFTKVLQTCGKDLADDKDLIAEVVLVREYDGAIMNFTKKGKLLQDIDNSVALSGRAAARQREKQVIRHNKRAESLSLKVESIDKKLRDQATKTDEQRGVCSAFVTFKREEYKAHVLDEYRFAQHALFRLFQSERLRFVGKRIKVKQACEPTDLYWENLDYDYWKRKLRQAVVMLLTVLVLVLCSLAIASLKTRPTATEVLRKTTWVVATTPGSGTDRLSLCNWQLFSSVNCLTDGPNSASWATSRVFTSNGTINAAGLPSSGDCASTLDSRTAPASPWSSAWVGVEFTADQSVQCMEVLQSQPAFAQELRIYACTDAPTTSSDLVAWDPADHCQAMEIVYPQAGDASSTLRPVPDASCATDPGNYLSIEVAAQAKSGASDPAADATLSCFCKQQSKTNLAAFMSPPYDTPAEALCKEWSQAMAEQYGQMVGSVIAVLVLNQVLLVLYSFFIAWERLCTVTEVTTSQLWKLFLSQFVNTGLLMALINANFQETLSADFPVVKLLQIGVGDYTDLNAQWFTAVGATLVITILMQVFSTTIPPLAMSYLVQPVLARIASRAKATQDTINDVYTLPQWNLSLRLAQTLNVVFCVMMYSGGMPVLYPIGLLYCIVAYWLDRWCLLRGSRRPPQYTQEIQQVSMHFLPWAAFLHVLLTAWTFGNQALFPSRWSVLLPLGEAIFGVDEARYDEVMEMYRSGAATSVTMDFVAARLLDFAREGTWLLMLIFLACAAYYAVYYLWLLVLRPFLQPVMMLMVECMTRACPSCCCARGSGEQHEEMPYEEATKVMERKGMTASYHLFKNQAYREATKALQHTEQRVRASSTCDKSPTCDKTPTCDKSPTDSSVSPTLLA